MEPLKETIQNSILSFKSKVLPSTPAEQPMNMEGGILKLHSLYDFFNLDFGSRTARESQEINRKLRVVEDYVEDNFDDMSAGLVELRNKFGANPLDVTLLDHFYHNIKYSNTSFQNLPKEKKEDDYKSRISEAQNKMESLRNEIREGMEKMKEAKELEKLTSRLAKLEEKKTRNETRLNELVQKYGQGQPQDGSDIRG
jgi:chromosome segregation ATPase